MGTSGIWREITLGLSQKRVTGGILRDIVSGLSENGTRTEVADHLLIPRLKEVLWIVSTFL
jgi:hypothetical protein